MGLFQVSPLLYTLPHMCCLFFIHTSIKCLLQVGASTTTTSVSAVVVCFFLCCQKNKTWQIAACHARAAYNLF